MRMYNHIYTLFSSNIILRDVVQMRGDTSYFYPHPPPIYSLPLMRCVEGKTLQFSIISLSLSIYISVSHEKLNDEGNFEEKLDGQAGRYVERKTFEFLRKFLIG
jgi:hypothetical protein